jgi:hypothetical protein
MYEAMMDHWTYGNGKLPSRLHDAVVSSDYRVRRNCLVSVVNKAVLTSQQSFYAFLIIIIIIIIIAAWGVSSTQQNFRGASFIFRSDVVWDCFCRKLLYRVQRSPSFEKRKNKLILIQEG